MRRRRPAVLVPAVAAAALGLLATGCGGGGGSPGVANLASSPPAGTTTATTPTGSGSGGKALGNPGGGPSGQFEIVMNVGTKDGEKFSECMRKHGVTSFPDPNSQGVIQMHSGMGFDPRSPAFTSSRATCSKLLPNGGQPTPAQIAQQQQQLLRFSTCMRSHGVSDFPDPSNGGLRLSVHPGSDLDPRNQTFHNAQKACQKYLPFKGVAAKGG